MKTTDFRRPKGKYTSTSVVYYLYNAIVHMSTQENVGVYADNTTLFVSAFSCGEILSKAHKDCQTGHFENRKSIKNQSHKSKTNSLSF